MTQETIEAAGYASNHRQHRAILLTASLVSSLVMLDSNVVAVALPTISNSLGADFADMQWVIMAYVLPFAALLLAAGTLGDIYGRRRIALVGQIVFAVASVLCGIAATPLLLNLARALQGVGASMLLTSSIAVINHSFQGSSRARAYAFWGASLGVAITSGPIVGGVISSLFGWQWAFLINLPICLVLIVATLRVIPESSDPEAKRLDYAGVATFSSGMFLLIWAVMDGNVLGWLSPTVLWRAAGGILLMAAFVVAEQLQQRPMVDLKLLRSWALVGSACAMLGYAGGAQVMIFYLPLYLQNAYGYAPVVAGVAMLPFALPMFLVPRLGARLSAALSTRALLCLGLGISTISNVFMALLAANVAPYGSFAVAMTCAGIGAGLLNGETAKAMQDALPAQRAGMGSGIAGTVRFIGLLFGVAGLGAVLVAVAAGRFLSLASQWQLPADSALALIKQYAAGDVAGALQHVPDGIRVAVAAAARHAFDAGFGVAAWTAAAVALAAALLTWTLMPAVGVVDAGVRRTMLVVPGE